MLKNTVKILVKTIFAAAFWLIIWKVAAVRVNMELLLPDPISVLSRMSEIVAEKSFVSIVAASLLRILAGIVIATVLGCALAVFTHFLSFIKILTKPMMTVIKATPVASFIILALVWLERDNIPIFISFLMVLPIVWTNITEGLRQIDKGLLEMSRLYKIGKLSMLKNIYFPAVFPYFSSSVRTSIGLAWKAGIAAEVLTVPKNSIGKMIYDSKSYFETTDLFAWTFFVIILSLAIELLLDAVLKKATLKYGRRAKDA